MSHHERDFLKGREAHRDEILNIFGIPIGLLSENATEANATVAERQFIERTLWPKLVRIAQKIAQELLPFWGGTHIAEFEDIRPTDTQARLEEIRASYPVLSINEIRARFYSLPPATWGELPVGASLSDAESVGATHKRTEGSPSPLQKVASEFEAESQPTVSAQGTKSALNELCRWERFALKRRTAKRKFEVRAVPDTIAFEIAAGLQGASSPLEVKAVFVAARASLLGEADLAADNATGTEG